MSENFSKILRKILRKFSANFLIAKYAKMGAKCEKWKVYSDFAPLFPHITSLFSCFASLFLCFASFLSCFVSLFLLFVFCTILHQGRYLRENSKARFTLFTNNSEIGAKRRKNDVRRIVYKRHLPCFANRFFAVRRTQDLRRGSGLIDEHKEPLRKKKLSVTLKLMANNEQCTATHSSRFRQQYFIRWKNNFVPLFVMFTNSV